MIKGHNTIREKAERWGMSEESLQAMCAKGKIQGATKFGKSWAIPVLMERPVDGRITSRKCRNWRE